MGQRTGQRPGQRRDSGTEKLKFLGKNTEKEIGNNNFKLVLKNARLKGIKN